MNCPNCNHETNEPLYKAGDKLYCQLCKDDYKKASPLRKKVYEGGEEDQNSSSGSDLQ